MKQTLIWFHLQRDGIRNGLSNIKETFAESLQLQVSVLHQRMSILQSSTLQLTFTAKTAILNIRKFSRRYHFRL